MRFEVWAPFAATVSVTVEATSGQRDVDLQPDPVAGTWVGVLADVRHGDRYRFVLDGGEPLADPASRWQPDGVHGPSAVVDVRRFTFTDGGWRGIELADAVFYELHVGTFTPAGTLPAAVSQLPRLAELGVTAVELMPVNAFPGERNWGYDGVFPSAVQASYGGPEGLATFVDAAHGHGLAVVLDVVYNHVGPEGSVLGRFGPYFTDVIRTPWGDAINLAGAGSDTVRRTFVESACHWITDFHVDGLRLDAVHAFHDPTALPFLEVLAAAVHDAGAAAGRAVLVIAESSDNDPRLVRAPAAGGMGCDAVWNDDVHHALRVALTGDRHGYYIDYDGVGDLAEALTHRWVLRGRRSTVRGRRHGRSADDIDCGRFVVFTGNHDQIGNTPAGDRPPYDTRRRLVAAATIVLSPFTPMLFMGEEYAETAPFPFFVDHGDPELLEAVHQGRRREFSAAECSGEVADPASPATFEAAVLNPTLAEREPHRSTLSAYTELLALRRRHRALTASDASQEVTRHGDSLVVRRERAGAGARAVLVLAFGEGVCTEIDVGADLSIEFDASDRRWGGDGAAATLDRGRLRLDGITAVLLVG